MCFPRAAFCAAEAGAVPDDYADVEVIDLSVFPLTDMGTALDEKQAEMVRRAFKAFREAHPDHIALTYINSSAEVKALSDIIVTSSSAETILAQIPKEQKIARNYCVQYLRSRHSTSNTNNSAICGGLVAQAEAEGHTTAGSSQLLGN